MVYQHQIDELKLAASQNLTVTVNSNLLKEILDKITVDVPVVDKVEIVYPALEPYMVIEYENSDFDVPSWSYNEPIFYSKKDDAFEYCKDMDGHFEVYELKLVARTQSKLVEVK